MPEINLPFPPGWEDMGADTLPWAWGGIKYTGDPAMAANPPTILALLSKLTGNVEGAKILQYAPGEMKNLPRSRWTPTPICLTTIWTP